MNVGLTRARSHLWVVGNRECLVSNEDWKALVDDASERDCACVSSSTNPKWVKSVLVADGDAAG